MPLYDRHAEMVARSLRRLGVTDNDLDDAVQDVFLVAHRRRNDFRDASPVNLLRAERVWLCGISVNVAREHRRRRWRWWQRMTTLVAAPTDDNGEVQLTFAPPAAVGATEELLDARRAVERLLRLLNDLPERLAAPIVLVDVEGLTLAEAASVLRIPLSTLHSRLTVARKRMHERFAHQDAEARGGDT